MVLVSDWAVKRAASKRAPDENVDDRGSRLNERAQSQEKLYSLLAILGYHAVVGDSWARLLIRARAATFSAEFICLEKVDRTFWYL